MRSLSHAFSALLLLALGLAVAPRAEAQQSANSRSGDFIVAVVNQELVTNSEVQQRIARAEQDAARASQRLPPRDELRQMVLDQLIEERAQLSLAREYGLRVDDGELERAVASVAQQNQLTLPQMRERLQREGVDYARFRNNVRDQLLLERLRDRELQSRVKVTDREIEEWINKQRQAAGASTQFNIAQILITVPDGATVEQAASLRARADAALARAKAGEDFGALVRELSGGARDNGGQLGLRPSDRLPDLFVEAVRPLKVGDVAPQVVRSGAGFHVLRLVERRDGGLSIVQHRARHILLRPGVKLTQKAAVERLAAYKQQVEAKRANFEDLARQHSEDGSAAQGGDLGWANPGQFVPEFEQVMQRLQPGQVSEPVVSRFGVHLIQLVERREQPLEAKDQREAARNALREGKLEEAYAEWARDVRARAYVELREPPL